MFIYKHFYTLMVANLNWHFYEVQKNLKRFNRTLTSYPQGWQGSFNASSGYSFSMKNMLITPILGLNYNRSHVFSYKEKGERFLHLKVDSFSGDSLQSACGLRYSWRKLIKNYVFLLNLEGNWEYEYLDQSSTIRTSFLDIDYAFTSVVPATNRNLFMGTVNLSTFFSKMAYELSYTAQYSPSSVLSNTVVAYLGYYF
ncbi:MAG: autotransporter outer membrane beta-barrel domain-containing protein [Chlamydiae bacterium]|nr:autotransporter outer membrane beta-barrel domain-containing protein [Chlamydiota bacterium]